MPKHPLGEIDRAAVQERKHIRNLAETPGYTGTFTSSAGKSDAVIRAEQDAAYAKCTNAMGVGYTSELFS